MNKALIILLSTFLLTGCDVVNSEFRVPTDRCKFNQKPQCNFKPQNNCWQKSVNVLMECVPEKSLGQKDVFSPDMERCFNNESGLEVHFDRPLDLYGSNQAAAGSYVEFKVYNDKTNKNCFRFKGQHGNFEFITTAGSLSVEPQASGDLLVECIDGTQFVVPQTALSLGCSGVNSKVSSYIPGIQFTPFSNDQGEGWSFHFLGLSKALGLFQCYE